jgi:hypothetical protein
MEDLTSYEAMRDAGATALEVLLAAKERGASNVMALVVLRKVFGLSLAEAYDVLKSAPQPSRADDMSEGWSVVAIDRRTRAPVVVSETYQSGETLRALMARRPDVERPDLVSWGNVTRAELDALIAPDYLWLEPETLAAYPPEQAMWSIFRERDE